MTKPREPHVEPTSGTNYSIYLWPRSKDPARDRIYQFLHDLGWRYDQFTSTFHTPETDTLQGFGRLETDRDCAVWARIQPPSTTRPHPLPTGETVDMPYRAEPILELDLTGDEIRVAVGVSR